MISAILNSEAEIDSHVLGAVLVASRRPREIRTLEEASTTLDAHKKLALVRLRLVVVISPGPPIRRGRHRGRGPGLRSRWVLRPAHRGRDRPRGPDGGGPP